MRFYETRENTAVLLTLACMQTFSNGFNFKLGMMIDTIVNYILILVLITLTMIQGHRNERKQTLLCQLSYKVFNGILYTVETCWCNEPHIYFIS